jgi:NADH pyrophosphatase NudC (nudix superfamily)
MGIKELEAGWQESGKRAVSNVNEWRQQHRKATLQEIEKALDEQLGRLRKQLLEEAAQASETADWSAGSADAPVCGRCGARLEARGKEKRKLTTNYDQVMELERRYGVCPVCKTGLFPPG